MNATVPSPDGYTLEPIPAHSRLRWVRLAPIFMSCMACIPLLIVGNLLIRDYSFLQTLAVIVLASLIILVSDWMNAAVGADLGLPAAQIAGSLFGKAGSRFLISPLLAVQGWGWYGVHIAIAAKAFVLMLEPILPGISSSPVAMGIGICLIGFLFALPSIRGQNLVAWTNYVSVIALLVLCFWSAILALQNYGGFLPGLYALVHRTTGMTTSLAGGVILIVGTCGAQAVLLSDYARFSRRVMPDAFLFPLVGIVLVGIVLYLFGATIGMSLVSGDDLITGLIHIGLPFAALILVIIAQWNPARVVNLYSFGLALATIAGVKTLQARRWFNFLTVLMGVVLAMLGILDHLRLFLVLQAFLFPAIGLMIALEHFVFSGRSWKERPGFCWKGLVSLAVGYAIALIVGGGYSFLLAMFVANALYSSLQWWGRSQSGDRRCNVNTDKSHSPAPFLLCGLVGSGVAAIGSTFLPFPEAEASIALGFLVVALGFFLQVRSVKVPAVPSSPSVPQGN